jgi:Fe-S-cluster containining protein
MDECFYETGLRFQCQKCSGCCRGEPGYVFLQEDDIDRLAGRRSLTRDLFLERCCRVVDMGIERLYSLKEKKNFDCLFWESGCSVYEDRPVQCSRLLESEEAWMAESKNCPGMGKGRLHSKREIEERLLARRKSKPVGPADTSSH